MGYEEFRDLAIILFCLNAIIPVVVKFLIFLMTL